MRGDKWGSKPHCVPCCWASYRGRRSSCRSAVFGWPEPGLAFDTVVHWGTALAVLAYFWRDWLRLLSAAARDALTVLRRGTSWRQPAPLSPDTTLLLWIVLGTLPAALAGMLFEDFFEALFARPAAVALFLLLTAAVLALSEWLSRRPGRERRDLATLTWEDALLVGLGQALAIFPGLSRSGTTIAAGLARGLRRSEAARFSFLLATPVVLGAGLAQVVSLAQAGGLAAQATALALGLLGAALAGLVCVHLFLRFVQRHPLYPFAIYCALAGIASLVVLLVRGG
jgi:undecaprenyl-diphosphatase